MKVPSFFIDNFDDITFENRNKEYGAYYLRTHQDEFIVKGFVGAFTIVCMIFLAPRIYAMFAPVQEVKEFISGDYYLTDIKVEKAKIIQPKKKPIKKPAAFRQQIKYATPIVVADNKTVINKTILPTNTQLSNVSTGKTAQTGDVDGEDKSLGSPTGKDITETTPVVEKVKVEEKVHSVVDEMPSYQGGHAALFKYLSENIRYPRLALENRIKGKVILQFVINTDGSIQDVKVIRGIGGGCDEEALNAVKNMPQWNPGSMNGKRVRVKYTLPVSFVPKE